MVNNSTNNKSLALSKLNCKIDDFSIEILDLVSASGKGDIYRKFVERFLMYIPVDYRAKDKIKLFGDFTDEAYEFFLKKPKGDRKIEIHTQDFQNNPSITILISAENRPFIIDSLNSLMSKLALQTIFTFHPVITTVRDEQGNLQDITPQEKEGINESLVYIKALGSFDDEVLKKIKSEISNLIDLVDYTYDSWQSLLNKLISITTDIVHHKGVYEQANLPAEETLDFLNWLQKNNISWVNRF